ncbi:MAG: hypothetical protein ACI90V_004240 [Bacillariaceae sp.]|jgi:hypothetical protein
MSLGGHHLHCLHFDIIGLLTDPINRLVAQEEFFVVVVVV